MGRAFTLIELVVVVVVLGIIAAVTIPKFVHARNDAGENATRFQLTQVRRMLEVYRADYAGEAPEITSGERTWGGLVGKGYLKSAPVNSWVAPAGAQVIRAEAGATPDVGYQGTTGWIVDTTEADVWAGGFDALDLAFPRP